MAKTVDFALKVAIDAPLFSTAFQKTLGRIFKIFIDKNAVITLKKFRIVTDNDLSGACLSETGKTKFENKVAAGLNFFQYRPIKLTTAV